MSRRCRPLFYFTLAAALAAVWHHPVTPAPAYRGLTARQWEQELRNWRPYAVLGSETWGETLWDREQPLWLRWAEWIGLPVPADKGDLPLLEGDADSVPVLIELLRSPDVQARQVAAQGLDYVGPGAGRAAPALRAALEDDDPMVREYAAQALYQIERRAATSPPP
jgi:HEAT repeat protein